MRASPAGWVSKVLPHQTDVVKANVVKATELAPNLVDVERAEQRSFLLGVTSVRRVTYEVVEPFLKGDLQPSFVVNIPRETVWTCGAIEALQANAIAFGGMGDLHHAVWEDDPRNYVFKEYAYVERRLRQHRRVTSIDRLYDRVWRVHRRSGSALAVAISNEYDLTADEVRTAHDRYAPFDILFHTNGLGRITNETHAAAQELGIELITSGRTSMSDYADDARLAPGRHRLGSIVDHAERDDQGICLRFGPQTRFSLDRRRHSHCLRRRGRHPWRAARVSVDL